MGTAGQAHQQTYTGYQDGKVLVMKQESGSE